MSTIKRAVKFVVLLVVILAFITVVLAFLGYFLIILIPLLLIVFIVGYCYRILNKVKKESVKSYIDVKHKVKEVKDKIK